MAPGHGTQVVDTDLDRPVYRSIFHTGEDTDDAEDESSADELKLLEPLRESLGSLQNLTRLRLVGTTPFGYALTELPPVKVSGACHVIVGGISRFIPSRRLPSLLHLAQHPSQALSPCVQELVLEGYDGAVSLPWFQLTLTRQASVTLRPHEQCRPHHAGPACLHGR